MWRCQGRKGESGLMLCDLKLCSFNLADKGSCFPISISAYNSVMHSFLWRRALTLSAPITTQKCAFQISGEVWKELVKLQSNSEIFFNFIWACLLKQHSFQKRKSKSSLYTWRTHGRSTNFMNPWWGLWWAGFLFPLRSEHGTRPAGFFLKTFGCLCHKLISFENIQGNWPDVFVAAQLFLLLRARLPPNRLLQITLRHRR